MRQTLRLLGIACWLLVSVKTVIATIDWFARWDWLRDFLLSHPRLATLIRTPFGYWSFLILGFLFLYAERRLKQPGIVARRTNSRVIPDLHTATMKVLFDTEKKTPGWDEHRFDWDWFIEVQMTNDSQTPTTIDGLEVTVSVAEKRRKRRTIEAQHLEDLHAFNMDMAFDDQGNPHGKHFVGERYRTVPSLMAKIGDVPLGQEVGYRGWLHFKVKQVNQREMYGGKISINIWLIDAMQRKHKLHFEKNDERNWDRSFFIAPQ
jgi:hypothetical protein